MSQPLGVAVIGLGFMGRTHIAAYNAAAAAGLPCRLVAVCDASPERLSGSGPSMGNLATGAEGKPLFDPASVRVQTDPERVFADPDVHIVSICTYTDTHVPLALRALEAGKHVLVEKPVGVTAEAVRPLADAAAHAWLRGRLCMPAMCMRFWPGWDWLHERVREGTYGRVRSATFQRLVGPPRWAEDFYRDPARSGGALVDLHIHDADFISWCFGRPAAVQTGGTYDHVTTVYRFGADGPGHVVAEGGWNLARAFGFRMRYTVIFDEATADFDIGRDPPLLLHTATETTPVPIASGAGYEPEVRHFVERVAGGGELRATMADALQTAEILDAERESMLSGRAASL
jgi:predicted dehydrogenase